jgi:hypothetical protein
MARGPAVTVLEETPDVARAEIEAAEVVLADLQRELAGLRSAYRRAVEAGDAKAALAAVRRQDEVPHLVLIAEVKLLQARASASRRAADALQPTIDAAEASAQAARSTWEQAINTHGPMHTDTRVAQIHLDDAVGAMRAPANEQTLLRREAERLERELRAKLAPASQRLAPVVRSLIGWNPNAEEISA